MSLSGHWWESTSPFLTLIGTVAGVVAVVAAVWATLYASRPRRGLAYSTKIRLPTSSELAALPNDVIPDDIKQRAVIINVIPQNVEQRATIIRAIQEDPKQRPVVVTFTLRGTGRLDVPTSAFDNETPITLSVIDAEIRSAISVTTRGGGGLIVAQKVRDNRLEIGPGLIGRNQILTYNLIAVTKSRMKLSGKAHISLTNALIDTKLRTDKRQKVIGIATTLVVCGILVGLWYGWLRHASFVRGGADPISWIGGVVAVIGLIWQTREITRKPKRSIEIAIKPPEPGADRKPNPRE